MISQHQRLPIIGPYPQHPGVGCHDYDPRAVDVAARVARLITRRLPQVIVEHIGSTAVPGCAGKGVVDLMVVYPEGYLDHAKACLQALGFQRQTVGHLFPEERPMRVGTLQHDGTSFRLHVHVIAEYAGEVASLRAFRDRLRADPALMAAYVARKRAVVATGVQDPAAYTRLKGQFIQNVHR